MLERWRAHQTARDLGYPSHPFVQLHVMRVAYATQFEAKFNRAITAREKVKSRLIGDFNPRQWDLPPKPKWMRWRTYRRLKAAFERYENTSLVALAQRWSDLG